MEKDTSTETDKKAITPEQAQALAEKVPSLLRSQVNNIPDMSEHIDSTIGSLGKKAIITGVGLGAVLGAASFTKFIHGKWKWVSGTAAVGSGALGLYANHKSGKVADAFKYGAAEVNKALLKYADTIENNETVRQQLANYLLNNITTKEMATLTLLKVPSLVSGKAIEFGQATQYLDTNSIADKINYNWRCSENPNKADCAIAR